MATVFRKGAFAGIADAESISGKEEKKKICMIIVAVICIFSITVYAEENCETRYLELLDRVKSSVELSDTDKAEYIPPLQKALQLCMEGKTEQAREIVQELRGEAALDTVF
jgi:hypothetical protein